MADISNIVDVTITKETQAVSQQGFGTPLIIGPNAGTGVKEVNTYESLSEVASDYADSTDEYKAANAFFAQSPRVKQVKIVRHSSKVAMVETIVLSADLITGNVISVKVDGVVVTETFAVSHLATMTAFAVKLAATAGIGTAVVGGPNDRTITCTAAKAGVPFSLTEAGITGGASQASIVMTITVANVGLVTDLNDIVLLDNDWYGLITTSRDEDEVKIVATWIEANYKIYFTTSSDADIYSAVSTTDIAYVLKESNRDRTQVTFNEDTTDWIDAGWMGKGLPYTPGSITWKFKKVAGPAASPLTATQRNAVLAKNANLFTKIAGVDMMEEGTMASGEFIDVIHGIDWLRARMAENIFAILANAKKVPYTDAGVAIIEAAIRAVLENAIKVGLLARSPDQFGGNDYLVTVPKVSEVSDNDKANRLLPDVTWQAILAGAIHKILIQGLVQV